MTPKHFLTMATIVFVGMLTFCSCNDDEAQYHAPVYKTITFSPDPCYPGDKVTATVVYSRKGENWYYFKQVFTLDGTKVSEKTKNSDNPVYMPDPPTCTFDAPAAGTHTFIFTCSPSSTVGNNLYPTPVSIEAKLVVSATDNGDDDEDDDE